MGLPINEQETVITWSRGDDRAEVYTCDSLVITKCDKLVSTSDEWKLEGSETMHGEVVSKTYSCPVKLISFRAKTQKIEMTEEQKKIVSERMREINARKTAFKV